MKCPNCGRPYDETHSICPECQTALGNALYTPVEKTPVKKGKIFLIMICILLLLAGGGYTGYYYYLKTVEKECLKITEKIMDCASRMDFTDLGVKDLPEEFNNDPNVRNLIASYIDAEIEEKGLTDILSLLGIEIDYDAICDQMLKHAEYEITDVSTTYNQCIVTVKTSNINYPMITENMKSELTSLMEESKHQSFGWWFSLKEWLTSILEAKDGEEGLPKTLTGWIDKLAVTQEANVVSGQIVYGLADGHWTMLSIDKNLFYNYYGFPKEGE